MGRTQKTTIINESGLYSLIFGSRLESASRFKRWVTSEVLPALRKTGQYQMKPLSLPYVSSAAELPVGSQVTVLVLGNASNAIVLGDGTLSNL